jgi:hypothetical protein
VEGCPDIFNTDAPPRLQRRKSPSDAASCSLESQVEEIIVEET